MCRLRGNQWHEVDEHRRVNINLTRLFLYKFKSGEVYSYFKRYAKYALKRGLRYGEENSNRISNQDRDLGL